MNAWYQTLRRPPLTPPDWIFGPVWTVLYLLIAAGIFCWARSPDRLLPRRTWRLLILHLCGNFIWTPLFFGLQSPALALADMALLWITLWMLLVRFRRESRCAWTLWLPYFFWVSFAAYLNAAFWWLNR